MLILAKDSKDLSQKDVNRSGPYTGTVPSLSWSLDRQGSIGEQVNLPSDGYYMVKVTALGESALGEWARMTFSINGTEISARIVKGRVAEYIFVHKLPAGNHTFSFKFAYNQTTLTSCPGNLVISPHMNTYPDGGRRLHTGKLSVTALESGTVRTVPSVQYPTIQSAIDASSAGDKVVVLAGTYNEQIVVKEGVILLSDDDGVNDDKVDNPLDDTLAMTNADTNVGQMQVLKRALRTIIDGSGFPGGGQAKPLVKFDEGVSEATILDGFIITNMPKVNHMLPGHAHTVECRGASPTIINNIIYNNGSSGIGSHATFRDEHIPIQQRNFSYHNIKNQAHPIINQNVCFKNSGAGIGNNYYSYASIAHNECFGNYSEDFHSAPGIGIQHGANPIVEHNIVHHNDWTGIGAHLGTPRGQIPCDRPTHPTIRYNECYLNGLAHDGLHELGIGAGNVGTPEYKIIIEGNTCHKNVMAGIGIRGNSHVAIRQNTCHHNEQSGIGIHNCTTSPLIKLNTCHDNGKAGIGIKNTKGAILFNNTAYRNNKAGIGLTNCVDALIKCNELYSNLKAGLGLVASNATEITGNGIHNNQTVGIGLKAGSHTQTIAHNNIHHNQKPGLALLPGCRCPEISNNIFDSNGISNTPNIIIRGTQEPVLLKNNTITNCTQPNVAIFGPQTQAKLQWNVIASCATAGVNVEENAEVTLLSNFIYDNSGTGIRGKNCQLGVYHNILADSSFQYGCALRLENSRVQVYNNIFYHNRISIGGNPSHIEEGYNCHFDSFCPPTYCAEAHNITSNPLFVNPDNHDYQLNSHSPCIDAGVHIAGINDGYIGVSPDIGAFERA